MPEVARDPQGEVAKTFQDLGVCVVQQCAKIRQQGMQVFLHCFQDEVFLANNLSLFFSLLPVSTAVSYDRSRKVIRVKVPDSDEEFFLHPATVRRNDRSAQSVVGAYFFL
jgi:hypothetical protein